MRIEKTHAQRTFKANLQPIFRDLDHTRLDLLELARSVVIGCGSAVRPAHVAVRLMHIPHSSPSWVWVRDYVAVRLASKG